MEFRPAKKRGGALAPNITPLIDVVFILLIFFMLTSTFRTERGIDVSLPESDTADSATTSQENKVFTIAINKEGKIFIEKLEIEIDGLKKRIKAFLAKHEKGLIVIESDGKADVQTLVSVMDKLREAEATNVTMATEGLLKKED